MSGGTVRPSDGDKKREGLQYLLLPHCHYFRPPRSLVSREPKNPSANPIYDRASKSIARVQPPRWKLSWKPHGRFETTHLVQFLNFTAGKIGDQRGLMKT